MTEFVTFIHARLQGDPASPSWRRSVLSVYWKDWCWSWNSNTLATWCKELTHLKRPWCWERLKVGGEGDARGWDGWMAWPTQWTCVWVGSGSWWWTGRPDLLQSMGSQSQTRLSDWTEWKWFMLDTVYGIFSHWEHWLTSTVCVFFFFLLQIKHQLPIKKQLQNF